MAMGDEALKAGVPIVTGDTKVVPKGKCDKLFITTTGIGEMDERFKSISAGTHIRTGDKIIINGSIGDHGIAILAARESLNFETPVLSDCAVLSRMIRKVLDSGVQVKFMRDATRGGLATVLCELTEKTKSGIEIHETSIQIKEAVKGACELFGFDPLYLANEGKVVMIVAAEDAEKTISILKNDPLGKNCAVIGEVVAAHKGIVAMKTEIGGNRIIDMPSGEMLPRIC
jgi:hydrogenase expression/formation protein HypE